MKNTFVQKYIEDNHLTVLQCDEEKPWGAYYVTHETDQFDEKILWVKPGEYLSLQYHGTPDHPGHRENGVALTDMAIVLGKTDVSKITLDEIYGKHVSECEVLFLKKGETFSIPAGYLHAYVNPFGHDAYLTEVRTSQISENANDREKNITRIYDTSMRNGTPNYPEWLREKINNANT